MLLGQNPALALIGNWCIQAPMSVSWKSKLSKACANMGSQCHFCTFQVVSLIPGFMSQMGSINIIALKSSTKVLIVSGCVVTEISFMVVCDGLFGCD